MHPVFQAEIDTLILGLLLWGILVVSVNSALFSTCLFVFESGYMTPYKTDGRTDVYTDGCNKR